MEIGNTLDAFCPCSGVHHSTCPTRTSSEQVLIYSSGKKATSISEKVRILKLKNFIFSKYNVMHNWTPLLAHTEPFHISASPICITDTSRRDRGNFFLLSFKLECSYIHKRERIIHLANKYIKSQLLEIFVNYLFTHLHKYREKER